MILKESFLSSNNASSNQQSAVKRIFAISGIGVIASWALYFLVSALAALAVLTGAIVVCALIHAKSNSESEEIYPADDSAEDGAGKGSADLEAVSQGLSVSLSTCDGNLSDIKS